MYRSIEEKIKQYSTDYSVIHVINKKIYKLELHHLRHTIKINNSIKFINKRQDYFRQEIYEQISARSYKLFL